MKIAGFATLMLSLIIVFDTSALPAVALSTKSRLLKLIDFIRSDDPSVVQHYPPAVLSPALQIQIFDGKNQKIGSCSSVVISNSGVILTAGHCIDACKIKNYIVSPDNEAVVDSTHILKSSCTIEVNRIRMPLNVIDTDGCPRTNRAMGQHKLNCPYLDWAFIQLDLAKVGELQCLAASHDVPEYQMPVATIGYPQLTVRAGGRSDARDSEGDRQYLSTGTIIPYQNYCVVTLDDKNNPLNGVLMFPKVSQRAALKGALSSGSLIQSDVDIVEGSSGGPLVSVKDNGLLAIAIFTTLNNTTFECKGSSFFAPLTAIRAELRQTSPNINSDALFNCKPIKI